MQAPNNKQSVAESPGVRRVLVESPSQSAPPKAPTKGPKTKDAPRRLVPVIAGKLCSKWCENQEITLKELQTSINEGSEPSGKFCLATALKAAELVMLAKTHSLTAKCAFILPAHCKEDLDDSLAATHKWVQVVGKGWIKCTVVPLTSSGLPAWPSSPTQVKVDEKDPDSAPGQVTVRITIPKCFANANVWQDILKKPNKVLAEFRLVGAYARSYGWKVEADKHDSFLVGYLRIPQDHVKSLLEVSASWGFFFNQISPALQKEPPVSWIKPSKKDLDPNTYLKKAFAKANEAKTSRLQDWRWQ